MTDGELCWVATLACDSPIEEMMRDALLRLQDRGLYTYVAVPRPFAGVNHLPEGIWIIPQAVIGNYRVDILVAHTTKQERAILVAVECDGHNWHERTPEQAARDKARDRALQKLGIQVLRFTGREIWRAADACATEVVIAIDAEWIRREDDGAASAA